MLEWSETTWGDIISLEYGKALRSHGGDGRVRVYGSNGPIGWTDKALADGPAVILGRKGAYRGVEYSPGPFHVIDTAYFAVPKVELDVRWLFYAIKYHKLGEIDDGSPIPSTTRAAVYVRELDLPSLGEQQEMASALSALDDKIELNRQMNETLEGMTQAIFRDWFVDFGPVRRKLAGETDPVTIMGGLIPDHARAAALAALFPAGFEAERVLPVGWAEEPVLDQANWVNGAAYKKMHFVPAGAGLPVIKIAELKAGVTPTTGFTNTNLGARYRIDDGELLFSWSGNPDTSIDTFIWTGGAAWLNQHIFAVRSNGDRTLGFLFAMLKYLKPAFAQIARDKQTTGLGHVTKEDLRRLRQAVPDRPVELAFDALMTPIFDKLRSGQIESRILAETRDYLLPRLMSGAVRVSDIGLAV